MDTENLSTTRTKIGDAINRHVAMTEFETEQVADAVLDVMETDGYQKVIDLQIQLEEIEGVASLAYESCDEAPFAGVLGMIERRIKAVRYELSDLIGSSPPAKPNGAGARPFSRKAMVLDLCRGIRQSVQPLIDNQEVSDDIGVKLVGVEKAAETIECIVSEGETGNGILSPQATLNSYVIGWQDKSMAECAQRLRQFGFDMSENIAADFHEDGFTVTKGWTPKGIRYFVGEREFLQSLLPDED